jgi:sugar/nucleoside kinase (ribokinase family)
LIKAPFDVVVIGNVGIDTNVYLDGQDIDFDVEGNFTHNLDYVGQAGGYTSRGYARLGKHTAFIGCVGEDYSGRFIRETFASDGINIEGMFLDPQGTSRSVNLMYRDGRRKNFYDGKGHMTLNPPLEKCEQILKGVKLAHFNIPNWARQLLPLASAHGVSIAVDLQDVVDINDPYRQDFITTADILFFSAANQADPQQMITQLLLRRPELVVVAGMGVQGCLLGTAAGGVQQFPAFEMESPVIDTNGAGDSLAVGFLVSRVLEGRSLEESIRRGQIAARHCCAQKASTDTLIDHAALDQLMEKSTIR